MKANRPVLVFALIRFRNYDDLRGRTTEECLPALPLTGTTSLAKCVLPHAEVTRVKLKRRHAGDHDQGCADRKQYSGKYSLEDDGNIKCEFSQHFRGAAAAFACV